MRMKTLILMASLIFLLSCNEEKKEEDDKKKIYVTCSPQQQSEGKCYRFMDRKIYLAFGSSIIPTKNNAFQKNQIKEALEYISDNTNLGAGYFSFEEVDPAIIEPITTITYATEFYSFIQVFPDEEFDEFSGHFGYVPDKNAILVLNKANKRKFYIIIRASCFEPNDERCTYDQDAYMGGSGINALIARQLGYMVGLNRNCSTYERLMCPDYPSDKQWAQVERNYWVGSFNNQLEIIQNTPDFYEYFYLD